MFFFFFFNDTATTEIYTLSLHDALPICSRLRLTEEEIANLGEHRIQEQPRVGRRPETRAVVDVERERGRLADRAPHQSSGALAERRRDTGQVDESGAPHRLPVHVTLREPRKRGVLAVVEHADRPRRHSVLEEVDADAGVLGHTDVGTIDAVPHELAPDPLAPLVRGEGGNPGYL